MSSSSRSPDSTNLPSSRNIAEDTDPASPPIPGLIGSGPAMADVYRMTRRIARSNAAVLLTGETGTGKELIAKALHRLSDRGSGPFVRVNCGALAENLLESELFGHVRGAFTGAFDHRTGRFEAAHGGTLFLDEINSTSPMLQVKLLRVLQEHEFERVGDTETIRVDVRVITASNQDLLAKSEMDEFREDLYYRLNVLSVNLPPLRQRREDISELVTHFLDIFNKKNGRNVTRVEQEAMELLQAYDWPGNVRELENFIYRYATTRDTAFVDFKHLEPRNEITSAAADGKAALLQPDLQAMLGGYEREILLKTLQRFNWHRGRTADYLNLHYRTLLRKMKQHDINQSQNMANLSQ